MFRNIIYYVRNVLINTSVQNNNYDSLNAYKNTERLSHDVLGIFSHLNKITKNSVTEDMK